MTEFQDFIRQDNNYRTLKAFRKAECVYDVTYYFANKFLVKGDRTIDQMVQAARSGKQNLAEGNIDGITSKEMELKLTNVNRASLHELLLDYEDYLRVRNLQIWSLKDERAVKTREFCKHHVEAADFMVDIDRRSDEAIANITLTLIHQFDSMMRRLLNALQKNFVEKGGIREQMTAARLGYRNEQKARIVELEAENAQLKARIAELEGLLREKGGGR